MWTRRDFLKTLGLFGGVLFTPLRWFIIRSDHSKYLYNYEGSGTLYGGFLLLPEGESPPEFVQYPKPGIPNLCNVGGNREITGTVETFTNISEVTTKLPFPMYTMDIDNSFGQIKLAGGYLLNHKSGKISIVALGFTTSNGGEIKASLCAETDFPRPLPLWSSEPVEPNGPAVILQKADFLPVPGILATTPWQHVFHWIENDIYFTLIVTGEPTLEDAKKFVDLLTVI